LKQALVLLLKAFIRSDVIHRRGARRPDDAFRDETWGSRRNGPYRWPASPWQVSHIRGGSGRLARAPGNVPYNRCRLVSRCLGLLVLNDNARGTM